MSDSVATPWTVAHQDTWDFLGKITGIGCHLPDQGIKPRSLVLQADSLLTEPSGKPTLIPLRFWRSEVQSSFSGLKPM